MNPFKTLIQLGSVSKCFRTEARGEVWAIRNFSLDCMEGELTCLLGPSGCGKSTLLRVLAGLEQPTSGKVRINGKDVGASQEAVGFISQEGDLLPWRTVLDNVALGLEIRGMPRIERHRQALASLRQAGLSEKLAGSHAHELSGGMRQRVALARALTVDPRLLLMDEPFACLDEVTRQQLQLELLSLWLENRRTLLFVTHSVEEAVFLADRIVLMNQGTHAAELTLDIPRPRDRFSKVFLEEMHRVRQKLHDIGQTMSDAQ